MAIKIGNPRKDKKKQAAKRAGERLLKIYKDQDARNEQRFQSDLKKAVASDDRIKKGGAQWRAKGTAGPDHLRESWLIGSKSSNKTSEASNVRIRKESGVYNSSPTPSGGSKKMIRMSKKRVRRNDASPQAKRSAKRLY